MTLSLNGPFGSGFMPPGTGVLLNNEMDDFVLKPGVANLYGLTGSAAAPSARGERSFGNGRMAAGMNNVTLGAYAAVSESAAPREPAANAIAPGKRPLSSMTPTFLETDSKVVVLGTPGGSRIITMVLLAALDVAHGHGDPLAWVTGLRFHHQFSPDRVEYEPGAFTPDEILALTQHGHALAPREETYGNMQLVVWDKRPAAWRRFQIRVVRAWVGSSSRRLPWRSALGDGGISAQGNVAHSGGLRHCRKRVRLGHWALVN